jgi:hypothetical protein
VRKLTESDIDMKKQNLIKKGMNKFAFLSICWMPLLGITFTSCDSDSDVESANKIYPKISKEEAERMQNGELQE